MDYKISREEVVNLVLDVIQNYCLENDMPVVISHGEELRLFGGESLLDSLGLVGMI